MRKVLWYEENRTQWIFLICWVGESIGSEVLLKEKACVFLPNRNSIYREESYSSKDKDERSALWVQMKTWNMLQQIHSTPNQCTLKPNTFTKKLINEIWIFELWWQFFMAILVSPTRPSLSNIIHALHDRAMVHLLKKCPNPSPFSIQMCCRFLVSYSVERRGRFSWRS